MTDLRNIDILDVLPQRPPFVFVDSILSNDDSRTVTSFAVKEDCLLVESGVLKTAGIMENMAQSCAARTGYIAKYILKQSVRIGLIGNMRNLVVNRNPMVGEVMTTTVSFVEEVFGISLSDVTVTVGDEVIASASLKNATV